MSKTVIFLTLSLILAVCQASTSQTVNPCAVTAVLPHSDVGLSANKVACTLPQLYGANGLEFPAEVGLGPIIQQPNFGDYFYGAQQQQEIVSSSITSNLAGQIALLPLVAPSSGITFTLDRSLGVYVESRDSYGPIFSERASTIGKHRLAIGASYQHLNFDSLNGIDLRSFPTTYIQTIHSFNGDPNCPVFSGFLNCNQTHDYVTAQNRLDITIQQVTSFVTFGLTRGIDVSVAVPYVRVQVSATAAATIVENSGYYDSTLFDGCDGIFGNGCGLQNTFVNSHHAAGLGDITVRAKGTIRKWEHSGLAAGIDVRMPTGDAINLLGSGVVGVKPFGVWSYNGRIAPHANVGYEWNGKSILGADVTTGSKASLPSELIYSVGIEGAVNRRMTATLDLIGQRIINGPIDSLTQVQAPSPCNVSITTGDQCLSVGGQSSTIAASKGSYGINNGDVGIRLRPFGRMLITASVLLKLDNGGLRSKATPLVSAIYTFH